MTLLLENWHEHVKCLLWKMFYFHLLNAVVVSTVAVKIDKYQTYCVKLQVLF